MTKSNTDPSGYYSVLGIRPGADGRAVKSAYRERAKALHPDRNADPQALAEFRHLSEAWSVLKDPSQRARYDAGLLTYATAAAPESLSPHCCCRCGRMTAQPRYVIFRQVKSYLIWAKVSRVEGVFCRDCADRAAAIASTVTWAWGWWSPPGLILSPVVLIWNMLGGSKPADMNARVLIRQAKVFHAQGQSDLATAVVSQVQDFARRAGLSGQVVALVDELSGRGVVKRLKNRWLPWRGGAFYAQLAPLVALPVAAGALALVFSAKPTPRERTVATEEISVQSPSIGEVRHVALEALKMRSQPALGSPVISLLDRFASVTVLGVSTDHEWARVRTALGDEGYVETRGLYGGSTELLRQEWCGEHLGGKPVAGEVLTRRASGEHQVLVHNGMRRDAVVKFKTPSGSTMVTVYLPATYRLGIAGIPDGVYNIEYATGERYSRGCGLFVEDMEAWRAPYALTLRRIPGLKGLTVTKVPDISLTDPKDAGQPPTPLSVDHFTADD